MKNTRPACCVRLEAKLAEDQADLRRAARAAARVYDSPRASAAWQAKIARARTQIETDKINILDHEAEHCND